MLLFTLVIASCISTYVSSTPVDADADAAREAPVSFAGVQFWTAFTNSEEDKKFIIDHKENFDLDIWNVDSVRDTVDFTVPRDFQEQFKRNLAEKNITVKVNIDDLQDLIDSENQGSEPEPSDINRLVRPMTWDKYYRLDDIYQYLDYLSNNYPDKCELIEIGLSHEGRPLKVLRVSSNLASTNRRGIWIDGGIHAREWISPAVVTNVLYRLLEVPEYAYLHNSVDWYIMPVMNVDGYEFSHNKNRMWRKNRAKASSGCSGTDLNRNFGYRWGGKGQSGDRCSEIFSGPSAFSEPESRAVSNFILSKAGQLQVYLTIHSYGQYILVPWGYDVEFPSDYSDLLSLAQKAASNMRQFSYSVGGSAALLYPASGGSDDWAKGSAGIKYSYTIELPDNGRYGFVLPKAYIHPVCDDFFPAIQVFGEHVATMAL